ncbi:MAG TPA: ATP-binding protein [Candidatus Binatia bacterium]|nr:ATP-binding protein [Candidatus Binatia bacterium]
MSPRRSWWPAGRTLSIRKYLVLLSVVTLVPLAIFAALLVIHQARSDQTERERGLKEMARALSLAVDEYQVGAMNSLVVLGTGHLLDASGRTAELAERIARVVPGREGWRAVLVLSGTGEVLATTTEAAESARIAAAAMSLRRQVEITRAPAFSPLVAALDFLPAGPGFLIAAPVERDGRLRSVVVAALDSSGLARILQWQVLPPEWTAVVVDPTGRVAARVPPGGDDPAAGVPSVLRVDAGMVSGWQLGVDRAGVPTYLALQRAPASSWGVGISVPRTVVNAPFWRSVLAVVTGGLLCLLVGAGLAAVVGRQLAAPLTALSAGADAIEHGRAGTGASPSVVREIAVLETSLARARQAIEERAAVLREADAAGRESQAWHAALAACAPVGLLRADAAGRATYVNERWTQLTGLSLADTREVAWAGDIPPDDRRRVTSEWAEARARAAEFSTEFRLRDAASPGGEYRWLAAHARPVLDADGRLVEWIAVLMDVTERKRAEAERAELIERAQAAQREAEAASRAKDEFLAALSHELRTPLNGMLLWVQVLREAPAEPSMSSRALEAIERSARLQARLIEDILDLARMSSGRFTVDLRPVDLMAVVRGSLEAAGDEAGRKAVELTADLDDRRSWVLADASRLQQVFVTLLSNAIRFTPKGGQVRVGVDRGGAEVAVSVRDTGEGIPPEFQAHLFERFRQADMGPGRRHGGLGLGLAIAREIVERHGGRIAAASQGSGRGAEFTVVLPVAAELTAASQPAVVETTPIEGHGRLDGIAVLLVEDDGDARELVSRTLGRLGASVVAVSSAPEGLEVIRRERPQVLVSDIGMPGMDGYDLIREVRAGENGATDPLPAVALTGYAGTGDRERVLAAGYQAHLAKPIDTRLLAETITALVARR